MKLLTRIIALTVLSLVPWTLKGCNVQAGIIVVTWTAPGDDCNTGTANSYELIFDTDSTRIAAAIATDTAGGSCGNVTSGVSRVDVDAQVSGLSWRTTYDGNFISPSSAGTSETASINVSDGTYFLAMRAVDESQNVGPWTNIVRKQVDATEPAAIIGFGVQ